MVLTWKYVKTTTVEKIRDVESKVGIVLPEDVKQIILKYNNGRPSVDTFDTAMTKGRQFKKLLSYNREDKENIYTALDVLSKENKELFPIGVDPSGNYICFYKNNIVLYLHETGVIESIESTFENFLNALY